jgi:outer membrane protein
MRHFELIILTAGLVLCGRVRAEDANPAPLTLDAAILYAFEHQPEIAIAGASVRSAEGAAQSVRSALMPSVHASASKSRMQDEPAGFQGADTSVTASQLLYDLGRTSNTVASARAGLRAARLSREDTRLQISKSVTGAYYALLQAEGAVAAYRDTLKAREAERDAAQARLDNGSAAKFDVLRAETALAQSRQALATAEGAVRNARSRLNTAIGRPANEPVITIEPVGIEAPDKPEADQVKTALEQRPDVQAARQQLESARRSLGATRVANAPTLAASGQLGGQSSTFPADTLKWSAGLSVSWTVFDGFNNAGQIKSAQAAVQRAEAELRLAELNATQQVTDAMTLVQTAAEQVQLGEATFKQATEARDVAVGRYQAGAGSQLEVSDAESQLHTARIDLLNARYDLARARRDSWTALGKMPPASTP